MSVKLFTKDGRGVRVRAGLLQGDLLEAKQSTSEPIGFDPKRIVLKRRSSFFKANFVESIRWKDMFNSGQCAALDAILADFKKKRERRCGPKVLRGMLAKRGLNGSRSKPANKADLHRFLRDLARKTLPFGLLGDAKNAQRFLSNLKWLIGGGKACTMRIGA